MKKLNIIKIISEILPPIKRMPVILGYLNILVAPLQSLNNWIADIYYPDVTRRIRWNAQVLLFDKLLNDLHNPNNYDRRIFITDGEVEEPFYLGNENEYLDEEPFYLGDDEEEPIFYLGNEEDYESEFDFIVHYPVELESIKKQIESSVKKYKIVGANYNMVSYE